MLRPILYNLRHIVWSSFCIRSVNCTQVRWPFWWRRLCNSFMHKHLTKSEGPDICRTRGKISGSHFVAGLLIVPQSHDYVDDIMCMIHLSCIHIWQSWNVLTLVESEIQRVVLILRLVCTPVAWPGWWCHLFNSFIIHIHLIKLEDPSTYWTYDTKSGLHFISSL